MTFKRRVLSALGKDELLAIGRELALDVTTRMAVDDLRDAVAKSKRAGLSAIVRESLPRDVLKDICVAVGLDSSGKEKAALVEKILAAGEGNGTASYKIDPGTAKGSKAAEGTTKVGGLLDGLASVPGKPPKGKGAQKRRRAGITDGEAAVAGTLKAALRQFALGAAGGYTGRDAHLAFTTHLLECFGWPDGRPPAAEIPRLFVIAEGGQRVEREVSLWWPERRAMLQVVAHDAVLDFAWKDLVRLCIQIDPSPQYVVLTNQRDLHLYDLARDREAPRLAIRVDDLPKYSEAFPFFATDWIPGATPKIVNVEKVSGEVAELVAKLYRSVCTKHPKREKDVIRFTLQCITAMFAEDIGLLPKNYFTSLLYEGAQNNDVERRLHTLFTQMNTPNLPAPRVVPYFNGGLFTDVTELSLGSAQVIALTKAAEANWTFVDPHIFGSVFQGIMDDEERHATGAHYTAHDDIMRVVGPTIVEPWRKRILAAASLRELTELRKELFAYRVLDPACGSGNFLYVAFRELYRLDTELLSRMREFPSMHGKLSWNGSISAANFYGIDINPFAVELAKVTLNIAKKIAYEERKAQAFALAGQIEMDVDPSLPLDNLDKNIVCADALFTDWPEVDAIVGNPPMLGDRKIRGELGDEYADRLKGLASGALVDLSCYWFKLAHERLPPGGRAGLVGTSGIRIGKAREASLDYIVNTGGTLTHAVSSRIWPGEAALNVSMVNWIKGDADPAAEGPFSLVVDDHVFQLERIHSHLQLHVDVSAAKRLAVNDGNTAMGVIFGTDNFVISPSSGLPFVELVRHGVIRPIAAGTPMLTGALTRRPDYCIYLGDQPTEKAAAEVGGAAFKHLKRALAPYVESVEGKYPGWSARWWQPLRPQTEFFQNVWRKRRIIACSSPQARPIFVFLSTRFVPNNTLQLFSFEDDYSFGILQSRLHWDWLVATGGRVRSDIRYTSSVWESFPWPQEPTANHVAQVSECARHLRAVRTELISENDWSLRQLHQAADVDGPHPLKEAQTALDAAVWDAYGLSTSRGSVESLLELNLLIAEDEDEGRKVRGPGLPEHLDPKDPRWMSTDCIEPPSVEN
ncbi:MAG: DNA methyltransferase [Kofleriaceae bacterium]